ncbi:MAG TPA: peptidoglycan DD-metalloendopeptidase family protein [Gemmatimonadales bacterium]|nr:peptidoglycan DD-metalloendopeptidase family protein [Gemmatimonadales bacterium]
MKSRSRFVTILVQRDGTTKTQTYRLRLATLRLGGWLLGVAALVLALLAVFYGPTFRAAARVPGMERELSRLRAENAKVRELSAALDSAESRYSQVRQMMGGEIVRDPLLIASTLPVAPPIKARLASAPAELAPGTGLPQYWPLDEVGYITRGQVKAGGRDEAHPGIDIAVSTGSLVRASGSGIVRQTGEDPEYGLFVLLEHADDYQTMYGHLSRILVASGAAISASQVIGLTGNSGRSTAPHLHFEIRRLGLSLDPQTMVKEGS